MTKIKNDFTDKQYRYEIYFVRPKKSCIGEMQNSNKHLIKKVQIGKIEL